MLSARTAESLFAWATFIVVFCPSPVRLLLLVVQYLRGVRFRGSNFRTGLGIHFVNTLLSPGIPIYMFYQWSKCGPGCSNGVVLIFFLPVVWSLFFLANWRLTKARIKDHLSTDSQYHSQGQY